MCVFVCVCVCVCVCVYIYIYIYIYIYQWAGRLHSNLPTYKLVPPRSARGVEAWAGYVGGL